MSAIFPLDKDDEKDGCCGERRAEMRNEVICAIEGVKEVEDCGEAEPDEDGASSNELECPEGGEVGDGEGWRWS